MNALDFALSTATAFAAIVTLAVLVLGLAVLS
ncbi:hypothetical protein QE428_002636 [Microbacterium sp. SORGH_AS 505]|nr:hypothetical protein [Microbacterium sp. SORGH_AS_0505]